MNMPEEDTNPKHWGSDNQVGTVQQDTSIDVNQLAQKAGRIPSQNDEKSKEVLNGEVGDIVELDDGTSGVIIDTEQGINKLKDAAKIKSVDNLLFGETPLYEHMSGDVSEDTVAYGDRVIALKGNPMYAEYAHSIEDVKKVFSGFEPTLTGVDLAGSEKAIQYRSALDALRSGEFVLPTVDQYKQQQKELEERKMEQREHDINRVQQAPVKAEVLPGEQNNLRSDSSQGQQRVINLAAMEEQQRIQKSQNREETVPFIGQEPISAQGTVSPDKITKFVVPEGRTSEFLASMPDEQKQKVEVSKVINVEEQRLVKVPVATRKITNIDAYKRISKNKITSEAVEVPLLNSGYLAVVKGCGSLEMASILPDVQSMEWVDYAKLYHFCFRNLVGTSIGTMSFRDFQVETSPYDLDSMVHGILRASQPDENGITLTCGGNDCGKDYDIKYSLSNLPDMDDLSDEIKYRIKEILNARSLQEDAIALHNNSPVMQTKYVDVGDNRVVEIKHPNGPMIIERTNEEVMSDISDRTNGLVALMLFNIRAIFIDDVDEEGKPQTYEVSDLESIALELQSFSDTQLEILRKELETLETYDQIKYSFKGVDGSDIVCPHCGLRNKKVPCKVQQLVFQRVSKAMN